MAAPGSSTPLRAHLRQLTGHSAIYGLADIFTNVINFWLMPLYTRLLGPERYGVLGILIAFSAFAKIIFRLGLHDAFFRIHYTLKTDEEKRRLAGTVALFAAGAGFLLFALIALASRPLTALLFTHDPPPASWLVLTAADLALGTLIFVPLNLLRIQNRPGLFSSFNIARHTVNIGLKVLLLLEGWGIAGVLLSDVIATGVFALLLLPTLIRNSSSRFSRPLLRATLDFALPKVPHGAMIQAQNVADRPMLDWLLADRALVGVYQVGYTLGSVVKFALSAFEPAWQPFIYAQVGRKNAPQALARVVTYVAVVFVATGLGVAALAGELVGVMTAPSFHGATPIVPIVTCAYVLHGLFLLTSIGIGVARQAGYYPLITAAAATANLGGNLVLIPRLGLLGAAWATVFSYSVMVILGFVFSRRVYPIPFEGWRLARILLAAFATYFVTVQLATPALEGASAFARLPGAMPTIVFRCAMLLWFPVLLLLSGFLNAREREVLGLFARRAAARLRVRRP